MKNKVNFRKENLNSNDILKNLISSLNPTGWMAIMSLYSSGRDPKNFSNPLKFAPERWMRDGSEAEFQVFKASASMPFAIGSRSCVGKKIATYEIHCLITKVRIEVDCETRKIHHNFFKASSTIHAEVSQR